MRDGRLRPGAVATGIAVLVILVSWRFRFVDRGAAPPLDLYLYFYPLYEATYGRMAQGILPLWNPYQLCGIPWVATLQGGFFYPFHALYLVLSLPSALAVSHGVHLVVVGVATLTFVRRLGLGWPAALLASALFALRGFIPLSLGSTNYLDAATWLPVGALAVLDLARGRTTFGVALLAAATGMSFLGGYPQPTVYMLYVWTTLLPVLLLRDGADARRWAVASAALAVGVALGAAAAAIQLAPTLELIGNGRHLALRPEIMAPFGNLPGRTLLGMAIAGGPFSYGAAALALAAIALLTRHQRALAWWATLVCLASAALVLSPGTPLFALYRVLPFLGMFRLPDRMLSVTDFAFAIAAAVGLDALGRAALPAGRRHVAAAGAALVVVVLAWMAGRGWVAPELLAQTRVLAVVAVGLLAAVALRPSLTIVAYGFVALTVVDISLGPWSHRMTYDSVAIQAWRRYESTYRTVAGLAGPDRVWFQGDATLTPQFAQKLATRYGLRAIDDYEPLTPGRTDEYFTYFSEGAPQAERYPFLFSGSIMSLAPPSGVAPPATRRRLLDLASLRYVVVVPGLVAAHPEVAAFLRDAGLEQRPLAEPELALYENPHALPRAYVTYRARPAPPAAELLPLLARDGFDPLALSYVAGDAGIGDAADAPAGHPARIVDDGERVVELDVDLQRPGLVVLADAVYPGWSATVDGIDTPILPTNHLYRGVPAPAGRHRVRFTYAPRSVLLGAVLSALGWVGIAVLAWRGRTTSTFAGRDGADYKTPR